MTKNEALKEIASYQAANSAIDHAAGLIYYDAVTFAPEGSIEIRTKTLGELTRMSYELDTDPKHAEALETLFSVKDELSLIDRKVVEELYRSYDRARKIPKQEMIDFQIHLSESEAVWHKAKATNDYKMFEPYLQKTFDTLKRFAGYTDPDKDPYDVALDTFERGLNQERCDKFFAALKKDLVPLIEQIGGAEQIDDSPLFRHYPKIQQQKFTEHIIDIMDIDRKYFTVGETEHPFTTNFSKKDVRITTHYYEDALAYSLYSVVHEGGHALYELHTADELFGTVLGTGVSMAIHESQSRFYENIIGRSKEFCNLIFPFLKNEFKTQFADVDADRFYRMINKSEPSLIRTEADELTYPLHIMVRYELEKRMFSGDITAKDLPSEWNRLYKEYLGIDVPDDRRGVLQDSHWSGGQIGYFPSYAIGSAYGPQYLREMKKDIDVGSVIESGKLTEINNWLCDKIWKYGCIYDPSELFEKVCGKFDPKCYTEYLKNKFSDIYGL